MASNKLSPSDRVRASYQELSTAAKNLNEASNELGAMISELDAAIQQLNLGVSAWITITSGEGEDFDFFSRDIGYAKIGPEWGIALRTISGNQRYPEEEHEESWFFNNAPRWMRIEGVAKIPDLLEKLTKQAAETTEKIRKKTAEAKELTAAIKESQAQSKPTTAAAVIAAPETAWKDLRAKQVASGVLSQTTPRK